MLLDKERNDQEFSSSFSKFLKSKMDAVCRLLSELESTSKDLTVEKSRIENVFPTLLLKTVDVGVIDRFELACANLRQLFFDERQIYRRDESLSRCMIGSILLSFADDQTCFLSARRDSRVHIARSLCRALVTVHERVSSVTDRVDEKFMPENLFVDRLISATLQFGIDTVATEGRGTRHSSCEGVARFETLRLLLNLLWTRGYARRVVRKLSSMISDPEQAVRSVVHLILLCVAAVDERATDSRSLSANLLAAVSSHSSHDLIELLNHATALFEKNANDATEGTEDEHVEAKSLLDASVKCGFSKLVHCCFFNCISRHAFSRESLRCVLMTALPKLVAMLKNLKKSSDRSLVTHFLEPLLYDWAREDSLCSEDCRVLESRCNAVMYALPIICSVDQVKIGTRHLCCTCLDTEYADVNLTGLILKGVSNRFAAFRPDLNLRRHGALVAAGFARQHQGETAFCFEEFPNVLQDWEGEQTSKPQLCKAGNCGSPRLAESVRRSCYPIDPDSSLLQNLLFPCDCVTQRESPIPRETLTETMLETAGRFRSVGVTALTEDHDPIDQLRHCCAQIIGSGVTNLQHETEHEKVERLSQGILSLPRIILLVAEKNQKSRGSLKSSVEPLLHTLIPSMFTSTSFPPSSQQLIADSRTESVLHLFSVSPKASLQVIGSMIFNASSSVTTKVELCRLVGQAAENLSSVPLSPTAASSSRRVLYPPMNIEKIKAVSREGKNTRRWGRAAHSSAGRNYSNEAAEIAVDVLRMFSIVSDTYSFQTDDMMFIPVEMLRSVSKLFRSISLARHVVSELAPRAVKFVTTFTSHVVPVVRAHSWTSLEQIMLSWRGGLVSPPENWTPVAVELIAMGNAALRDEKVPHCTAAIVELLHVVCGKLQECELLV